MRSGEPNPMRFSRPVLTVPLLLRTHHQEEGDGASEREDGTSGVWAPQGSFFEVPGVPTRCVGGNPTRFQKEVHNSSRKSYEGLKSANTLSVFVDCWIDRLLD